MVLQYANVFEHPILRAIDPEYNEIFLFVTASYIDRILTII